MEREQRKLHEKRQLTCFRSVGLVWQCVKSACRCLLLIIKKCENLVETLSFLDFGTLRVTEFLKLQVRNSSCEPVNAGQCF